MAEELSEKGVTTNKFSPLRVYSNNALKEVNRKEVSDFEFQKRKRIMSTAEAKATFKKRFSPKKKSKARKTSITNSEFKAFYSAFEKQAQSQNSTHKISGSYLSNEGMSTQIYTESSSPPKIKGWFKDEYQRRQSLNPYSQIPLGADASILEPNGNALTTIGEGTTGKHQRRSSAMVNYTSKNIPILSTHLLSIVDTLRELESEISDS